MSGRRIGPDSGPHMSSFFFFFFFSFFFFFYLVVLLLFCPNHPFVGIDSDTLKRRGSACIILIITSRKTVKITSGFPIPIRQHYALTDNLMRGNSNGHCPTH